MAPSVYLVIKLSSPSKTKPTYKIGELGPTGLPSKHIEDPTNRTTKTIVVVKKGLITAEPWNIKIDFDKSQPDSSGSIEAWFHDRDTAETRVEELLNDIVGSPNAKPSRKWDKKQRLKGLEVRVAESGRFVWVDVVEVELEQLEQDRFGVASGYVG